MHLTSVVIVLIHLLYATAWAAPTRPDNKLLPRGPSHSLESKHPVGPVQQLVESITKDNFIGSGCSGRVFRPKQRFNNEKVVVKVMKKPVHPFEASQASIEIEALKKVQQYRALGIALAGEHNRLKVALAGEDNQWKIFFIVMKDMGVSAEEMWRRGIVPWSAIKAAAAAAIKRYREQHAMESPDVDTSDFKNFAFEYTKEHGLIAHIVDWMDGKEVKGITPAIKVDLTQQFPTEYWHSQHVNPLFLQNLDLGHLF
ncbi:hypothetical protein APHAL10511_002370 [Amanita phalloides]|nr:hypothetical protein APHAL10511_002370 [Amanita phalloides]